MIPPFYAPLMSEEIVEYRGLKLDRFQREAIEALQRGDSVLVAAPTGTGKTVVADWIVDDAMSRGCSVIYTAPIKALSNQKFRDYCSLFGEENVGLVTGDLVIRREAPCKVMTTEILRNMLLSNEGIGNLAAVIIDEIHFLDDRERGTTWEEVLIYLPPEVQIVGLSATLSNMAEFSRWLSAVRNCEVTVVEEHRRAVPLSFKVATKEGQLTTIKKTEDIYRKVMRRSPKPKGRGRQNRRNDRGPGKRTTHIDVFWMMGKELQPYLYFVFSRARAEQLAQALHRSLRSPLTTQEEENAVQARIDAFREKPGSETALDPRLERLYRWGIAFHHAGLHVMLKSLVEELYEAKLVKVLYCTGTFALGINMPARSAVFDSLQRYDGRGMIPLPTREFMQMAGRAGRRGMDEQGMVAMRMDLDQFGSLQGQIKRYLSSKYEPVHSRFSLSFNSVVNLMHRHEPDKIRLLVEKSFLAWHRQKAADREREKVTAMEEALSAAGFGKKAAKRQRKEVDKLRQRAESRVNQTWEEFQDRILFLQTYGYLEMDLSFNAGANVLMHFQIQEIFACELFLEGFFEELTPPILFGVLCGMVVELPRGAVVHGARKHRGFAKRIQRVANSEPVREAFYITHQPVIWEPAMIPVGKAWAEGKTLAEILLMISSDTDISGTLVGAFRRAKELATQLRNAWSGYPEKTEMMSRLLKSVGRDEVEVVG
jgi:ATP-dependent RNA helicase HelY